MVFKTHNQHKKIAMRFNKIDLDYQKLLGDILENGVFKKDRTGTGTISVFGRQIRHNMKDGFPLLTTKKMSWKQIKVELMWFLRGDTNIKFLVDNDCHIWDGDTYKSFEKKVNEIIESYKNLEMLGESEEINSLFSDADNLIMLSKEEFINRIKTDETFFENWGDLGPIYGKQWRNWNGRLINGFDEYQNNEFNEHIYGIDQITNLIKDLKNNPDSRRLMVNAWNVGQLDEMALPPCFTEDIMVACVDGYRKISEITENDLVLTENGSYQKVYDLHETKYDGDLVKFKVFGNTKHITCTPNHPFLVKDKGYICANELTENDYLALPINKKSIVPSFDTWLKDNQYAEKLITTKLDNFDYWFLMGYFLGDGWLIDSKEEIYFTIKNEQTDLILPRLKNIIGLSKLNNSGVNCTKYVGKKKQVFDILSKFGKYAEGKLIPSFIHDAPKEYIEHFIEGYLMADGCKTKNGVSYTTVSENIAYGLQLLYAKLGVKASVYFQNRPKKTFIEGREVNQKNTFSINVYKQKNKSKKYILDTDYLWVKIKEINKIDFSGYVYNISVEDNHTYNVYNIINHNCHYGFQVYTRELSLEERWQMADLKPNMSEFDWANKYCDDLGIPKRAISLMWNQRSVDTFLGLPFNIASYGLLLELIAKAVNMVPDELIGNLGDVHLYSNHIAQAKEQMERIPYELPTLNINTEFWPYEGGECGIGPLDAISVFNSFKNEHFCRCLIEEDIQLSDYKSHPAIKAPLSN